MWRWLRADARVARRRRRSRSGDLRRHPDAANATRPSVASTPRTPVFVVASLLWGLVVDGATVPTMLADRRGDRGRRCQRASFFAPRRVMRLGHASCARTSGAGEPALALLGDVASHDHAGVVPISAA